MVGKLIMIRGIPGSGKSTMARGMIERGEADSHYEPDMFYSRTGTYVWYAEEVFEAHAWCMQNIRRDLIAGKRVVMAHTFIKCWEIQKYAQIAKELGLKYEVIEANGCYQNLHQCPEHVLNHMRESWEEYNV